MASEYSRDQFGALGIPLREVSHDRIWEAESTYSESGPIPGLVTPSATGQALALRSHGTTSSGQALDLRIARSGYPGPRGVALIWRNQASPVEAWRGQDVPSILSDLRTLTDGANTRARDLISLPDGQAVAVYEEQSGGAWSTKVRNMTAGGAWSSAVTLPGSSSLERYPAIVRLPDDRILLFQWNFDGAALSKPESQIEMWSSTNYGASWRKAQAAVLVDPVYSAASTADNYTAGRIAVAYSAGELIMFAALRENVTTPDFRDVLIQWASFDYGHTFDQIALQNGAGTSAGAQNGTAPAVVGIDGGGFVFAYVASNTTLSAIHVDRLGTAGTAFRLGYDIGRIPSGAASNAATYVASLGTKVFNAAECSLAVTSDGTLYLFTQRLQSPFNVGHQCGVIRSDDGGATWRPLGRTAAYSGSAVDGSCWFNSSDQSTGPSRFRMAANQGRILAVMNHDASAGTRGNDLSIGYIGGHSQITMAAYSPHPQDIRRVAFEYSYRPFDLPDATGGAVASDPLPWTLTSAGSPSVQLRHSATYNALQLQITTAIGESNYYGVTPPGSPVEGLTVLAELFYNSGPSTPTLENGIAIVLADLSDDLDLEVRLGSDGFLVYDNNAAAQVGSEATGITTAAGIQILISVAVSAAGGLGRVSLWYRAYQANAGSDRTWTRHLNGAALTNNTGSPSPTSSLEWGAVATAIAARTCRWSALDFASDEFNGAGLHSATLPDDLHPIPLGPAPVWIDSGLSVSAVGGPGFEDQEYTVEAEHRYGLDRLDWRRYPSPRQPWRSTGTVAARIAWRLDQGLGETAYLFERGGIALYLEGINWQTGLLQAHNGSTWSTIATLNAAAGATGLPWTRAGARVHPGASAAGARYYQRNELAGGTFNLDGDRRRIVANTAGLWVGSSTSTVKRCIIELEGVTGAEAASGSSGQIWAPRLLAYAYSTGAGAAYQGIRVQIDGGASNVRDTYQEIGAAIVAGIVPLPWSPGGEGSPLGFTLERQIEVTTLRDGSRSVRRLGPDRRVFEIAWPSAPTAGVWRASPDPEYVATTSTAGAEPAASRHELPYLIEGILREGEGGPLLWIPRLDRGPPDSGVLTSRERVALVRVAGDLERRVVYGSPISSEVVEVEGVRLEEVL